MVCCTTRNYTKDTPSCLEAPGVSSCLCLTFAQAGIGEVRWYQHIPKADHMRNVSNLFFAQISMFRTHLPLVFNSSRTIVGED